MATFAILRSIIVHPSTSIKLLAKIALLNKFYQSLVQPRMTLYKRIYFDKVPRLLAQRRFCARRYRYCGTLPVIINGSCDLDRSKIVKPSFDKVLEFAGMILWTRQPCFIEVILRWADRKYNYPIVTRDRDRVSDDMYVASIISAPLVSNVDYYPRHDNEYVSVWLDSKHLIKAVICFWIFKQK